MSPKETAKAILELLGPNGENWCKGELALTSGTIPIGPSDSLACRWCISGAAMKVTNCNPQTQDWSAYWDFVQAFRDVSGFGNIPVFNDRHGWSRVKTVLTTIAGEQIKENKR